MRKRRGTTLMELVIYCFILVILVGVIGYVLVGSKRTYEINREAVKVQQSVLMGLHRIGRELRESRLDSVWLLTDSGALVGPATATAATPSTRGIVLLSARGMPPQNVFHLAENPLAPAGGVGSDWRKWIAYFVENIPAAPGTSPEEIGLGLYRVEVPLTVPGWPPPPPSLSDLRAAGAETLIVTHLVHPTLPIVYEGTLAQDVGPTGTSDPSKVLVATPVQVVGPNTFTTSGFLARVWRFTAASDPTVQTAPPRLQVAITAADKGIGTIQSGGIALQRYSVSSSSTEVEVKN